MAISTLAGLRSRQTASNQRLMWSKAATAVPAYRPGSTWTTGGFETTGVAPTTAVVPTNTTAGALGQLDATGGVQRVVNISTFGVNSGMLLLADRLSHQGGLSGLTLGAQTTNLPTAALTRSTDGIGVWPCVEIYTQIGTVATTLVASYTNTAGTAGRTTQSIVFGDNPNREAKLLIPLPLQQGDIGCKSVESVTIGLSTGTAGNFGITLIKPILAVPSSQEVIDVQSYDPVLHLGGYAPQIVDGACLMLIYYSVAGTSGILSGELKISED